ncbi:MAG: flagellar biosynthesis anti-sigma factor FlgM [Dehalobacterium sp.]
MKINGFIPSQAVKTYATNKKSEGVSRKQDSNHQDCAEISQKAKDLQELFSHAADYPEIRMENVMSIRDRLDKYEIDLDQLADNIVQEMVDNKIIKGQ